MDKIERKQLTELQNTLNEIIDETEKLQQSIDKRVKRMEEKFPESPTTDKLVWERDNLVSVVEELALARAFLRQTLEGER